MKEYYDLRAPYYDDWYPAWALAARDRPGWQAELDQALAAIASLPSARTLDVACGTGFLTQHLAATSSGSTRARACSGRRGAACRSGRSCRVMRSRSRFRTVPSTGLHEPLLLPPRRRRPRRAFSPRRGGLRGSSWCRRSRREGDELTERWKTGARARRLYLAGLQALVFDPEALAAELGGRRCFTQDAGSSSCAHLREAVPLARRRSSATTARAARASRPATRSSRCPVETPGAGQRAYLFGQAPGIVEGEERRPWRGRAGRTLRRWLELDEDEFYATFYCASVTRCYPGTRALRSRRPHARRRRSSVCVSVGATRSFALLRPQLIVTVGGLAARRLLGIDECHRWSGALRAAGSGRDPAPPSVRRHGWLNVPANRALDARSRRRSCVLNAGRARYRSSRCPKLRVTRRHSCGCSGSFGRTGSRSRSRSGLRSARRQPVSSRPT